MIKKVNATNFLSWRELEFSVTEGVTLIDGWNQDDQTSEGSGKSAVLNAISWAIFGKIPKDAKVDDVIKSGEKSCIVEVEFTDFKVIRSRKPNDLYYVVNGVEERGKDAKETQDKIEKLVGMTFETFCQTVYFAQNYTKKFITSNQEEKAKILSEIQNLEIFDRARKKAQDDSKFISSDLDEAREELTQLRAMHQISKGKLENLEKMRQHMEEVKQDNIREKEREVASLSAELLQHKLDLEKLFTLKKNIPVEGSKENELREALTKAQIEIAKLDESINNYNQVIKARNSQLELGKRYGTQYKSLEDNNRHLQNLIKNPENNTPTRYDKLLVQIQKLEDFIANPTNICPTCGTELETPDTSHSEKELAEAKSEVNQILEDVTNEAKRRLESNKVDMANLLKSLTDIKKSLGEEPTPPDELKASKLKYLEAKDKIQKLIDAELLVKRQYDITLRNIESKESTIDSLESNILFKKDKIDELRAEPVKVNEKDKAAIMHELTKINADIEENQKNVSELKKHYDSLQLLRDGFKELKTHVFNSALAEINNKVAKYLNDLFETPIQVTYENENMKIETKIILDGEERGLGLLSGGQFRRVSLATDLAIADVVNSRIDSKFGITILDEYMKDLSEASMTKCLDLLQNRKNPVIMIEHNSVFKQIIDNTFFAWYENGTSSRKD